MQGSQRLAVVGSALALVALGFTGTAQAGTTHTTASAAPTADRAYDCPSGSTAHPLLMAAKAAPPHGFHPLTASDADLKKYGFPVRPKGGTARAARWKTEMSAWKGVGNQSIAWTCSGVSFGPGGNYDTSSRNWAGNVDHASAVGSNYNGADGTITGPVAGTDYNHCDESDVAPWVGVGGGSGSGDELIQTGEDVAAQCGRSQWTRLWYEVFPASAATFVDPFSTGVGDNVYFDASYDGGSCGSFYMQSGTSGLSGSYSECFNGSSGGQADWITEKVGNYPLATWSTYGARQIDFLGAYGYTANGRTIAAGIPYHQSDYMVSWLNGSETAQGAAWTDPNIWSSFPVVRDGAQSQ